MKIVISILKNERLYKTVNGHDKKTNRKILKKILSSVWLSCILEMGFVLMAIAETDRQFKPGLSRKGSARPDRLDILGDQAFYINHCNLSWILRWSLHIFIASE